ncbi:MAG: family 10 glycosylhydrolase [Chlorobi bacterium]|nr:family 10 glycosylhydrolase [Chlorobiota bacterium]
MTQRLEQPNASKKYETRAVWVATIFGLDWPSRSRGRPAAEQKQELLGIFSDLGRQHFNTVYFQVRSRGNALYKSSLEPWALELTGHLGQDPGWDPLAVAVEAAHEQGMEIHGWFNVFKVWGGGNRVPRCKPLHVALAHPEWVKHVGDEIWIDPGIPEARQYIVDVIVDCANRYDLDGVHLDYIRYPGVSFNDRESFRRYGQGRNREEWRRQNISLFVQELSRRLRETRPWMKIGAAPIGIYKNIEGVKGWQAYSAVYQDSRLWLREGWLDYLAPQIYWGLKSKGSRIDVAALARDWFQNAAGRNVVAGLAAYKKNVANHLERLIDTMRVVGLNGQSFFRYAFIRTNGFFKQRYAVRALPARMSWMRLKPPPPVTFSVIRTGKGNRVEWKAPTGAQSIRWFVVYRGDGMKPDINDPRNIYRTFFRDRFQFLDTSGLDTHQYVVTSLSPSGLEGPPEEAIPVPVSTVAPLLARVYHPALSISLYPHGNILLVGYTLSERSHINLRILGSDGREIVTLVDEEKPPGIHVAGIALDHLPVERMTLRLESGSFKANRDFSFPD